MLNAQGALVEAIFALVGLLLVGSVFIVPFVALSMAHSANRRAKQFEAILSFAEHRAEQAERRAAEVDARLTAWVVHFQGQVAAPQAPASHPTQPSAEALTPESGVSASLETASSAEATSPSLDVPVSTPSSEGRSNPDVAAMLETQTESADSPPAQVASLPTASPAVNAPTAPVAASPPFRSPYSRDMPKQSVPGFDWERLVGVRLFAWLGGGALFLAAALFLQFSIQQNLVSPELRVASGLLFGALALFGGDRLRARTPLAGNALCGAGVAILYAALYAAHGLYGLVGVAPAFGGMALVTLTAGLMAVRQNAYFVALLGLLGGMTTPYLLSTGEDRPLSLFLYVAALSAGIVYVSSRQGWPSLELLGLLGASFLFLGWSAKFLDAPRSAYALFAFTFVVAIYALSRLRVRERHASAFELALGVATVFVPLLAALGIGVDHALALPPFALALHLIAVSALTWFVAKRDSLPLGPVAAGLTVLTWLARLDAPLLRSHEPLTFFSMALVPSAYFAVWLWRRRDNEAKSLYPALLVVLVGVAPLSIAARMARLEGSFAVGLLFVSFHALLLVAVGALAARGVPLVLAQLVMLASLTGSGWYDSVTLNQLTAIALIVSGLFFYALPLAHQRLRPDATAWIGATLALPAHYLVLYACIASQWGRPILGMLALAAAALSVLMLTIVRNWSTDSISPQRLRALLGGGALTFLTASVPILLSNEWLTVSWALEVMAICWLYRRVPERGLLWFALALALGVAVRLLFNPAVWLYHPRASTPFLNHYLYTFGVPIGAFFVAARLIQHETAARRLRLSAGLEVLGTVFLFMLLNVEIADYFSSGQTLTFRWNGGGGLAEDMTYSLVWGAFGIGLLVVGLLLGKRAVRIGSLFVLVLTIGKVFLHDLWELGSLYRVGSIVGLALALLGVSYLTQRYILPKETP